MNHVVRTYGIELREVYSFLACSYRVMKLYFDSRVEQLSFLVCKVFMETFKIVLLLVILNHR